MLRAIPTGAGRYPVVAANTGTQSALAWLERSGKGLALRTATVSTSGRLTGRRTVARSARRADLAVLGIGIDARGRQHLVYADGPRKQRIRLRATNRRGNGRWDRAQALGDAATGGLISGRTEAVLATSAAGDTTAVWCLGGQADNVNDFSDPGTLYTATLQPGKRRWPTRRKLWRGQFCSFPQLVQNTPGDLLAIWYAEPAELDYAPTIATRSARGRWSSPHVIDGTSRWLAGNTPLGLGDDRSVLFAGAGITTETGKVARTGIYTSTGALGPVATLDRVSRTETDGGWVGAGDPYWASAPIGTAANSTTLVLRGPRQRSDGGTDLPALWAATGGGTIRAEQRVDDLAAATDFSGGSLSADLTTDPSGRPVAMWSAGGGTPCTIAFYRSTLTTQQRWSRRALVATRTGTRAGCDDESFRVVGNGAFILAEGDRAMTDVWHASPVEGTAPTPTAQLRTTSWNAVRAGRALEVLCRAPGARLCTVSLVPALQDPSVAEALEIACRPAVGSGAVGADGTATIRFPLTKDCYEAATPPLPATTIQLPLLTVADAIGRESAATTSTVTITP